MTQTYLYPAYAIGDGDFADVACLDCARTFATEHNLTWYDQAEANFTVEDPNGAFALVLHRGEGESDYPYGCCDDWLETTLTPDGEAYVREHLPRKIAALYLYESR